MSRSFRKHWKKRAQLRTNVGKSVMTKVVSCVKQAPEKGTEIICRLKDGIQMIITENIK